MSKKQLRFDNDAWNSLLSGSKKIADAVGATLGPNGRTVMIEKPYGDPKITKDGVSVAKEIELEDNFENLGVKTLKSIASRMSEGDGTTSSIVFSYNLLQSATKYIIAGHNISQILRGIEAGIEDVISLINKNTKPIKGDKKSIEQVATVSANGDEKVGQMVAEAFEKVGDKGVITVEESKTGESELDVVDGMEIDKGYISPYFITNQEKSICELKDAVVLLYDGKISSIANMVKLLEDVARQGKALLIIAEDVDGDALNTLIINKLHNKIKVAAVKSPSFGDRSREMMQDIALLTGGEFITPQTGMSLENADISMLGKCGNVVIGKESTVLAQGKGSTEDISSRIDQLEKLKEQATSSYDKEKYSERIAKLSKGVGVIRVGGHSSLEIGELKDRVEDAVHAVKAAIDKGIVPGGGTLFLHAAAELQNKKMNTADEQAGLNILIKALQSITARIVSNSGIEHGSSIVQKVLENKQIDYGYDARNSRYGSMIEFGVIDAAKVLMSVLRNGFAGVKTLISTNVLIVEAPTKKDEGAPGAGMGDMGGMGY